MVRQLCDDVALAKLSNESGMKTFDHWVPASRAAELIGRGYDTGNPDTLSKLLHKGRQLRVSERSNAEAVLKEYVRVEAPDGWMEDQVSAKCMLLFTAAHRAGTDTVTSQWHARSTHVSCFLTVQSPTRGNGQPVKRLAEVLYLLLPRCQLSVLLMN